MEFKVKSKISRIIPAVLFSSILILSLIGCSSGTPTPAPSSSIPAATSPGAPAAQPAAPAATTVSPTTRTITDMFGRKLSVPNTVNQVLTTGPIEMELVYLLAPDKLAGLSFTFNGKPALVADRYQNLPVVGGWFGTQTGNYETFIAARPDIVLEGTQANLQERQGKFGTIPVVGVAAGEEQTNYADDALTGYEAEIRFLGDLLGVPAQAQNLIAYYTDAMAYVNKITATVPEASRIKVYYAEGKDGFSTDPVGSMHTRLLEFCGGRNVAQVTLKPGYGMADASLEQILLWDPDMVIIGRGSQATLYNTLISDARWSQLRAVKNQNVAIRPDNPLSWFDGPPGPCQMVGMYWMVNKLYPAKTKDVGLNARVKEFYTKFFHYDLTDAQLAQLLANPK
jgi:iron complex transport system substrate-binding protein